MSINWRFFSLEQVNSQEGPQRKIWEQPEDYPSCGLHAFWAAEAARKQGKNAFDSFHAALLRAKHEQQRDITDVNTLIEVADSVTLDIPRFQKDLANRQLLAGLAQDHSFAVDTLGIFGTPTLVFPDSQAVFLKMAPPPLPEECLSVFTEVCRLAEGRTNILEIKRPSPPNPKD